MHACVSLRTGPGGDGTREIAVATRISLPLLAAHLATGDGAAVDSDMHRTGMIALGFALFLVGSLHFAVEDGARCASVKTTICKDATSTIPYTQGRYLGPNVSPTFTYASATCGNSVSGSVSYSSGTHFLDCYMAIVGIVGVYFVNFKRNRH